MFGSFGFQELLLILLLVIIIFGASKLPQLGRGLGEGIRNFKDSIRGGSEEKRGVRDEKRDDVSKQG